MSQFQKKKFRATPIQFDNGDQEEKFSKSKLGFDDFEQEETLVRKPPKTFNILENGGQLIEEKDEEELKCNKEKDFQLIDEPEKNESQEEKEEEDPLEAYMAGIEDLAKKEASAPTRGPRALGMADEQEDIMESYLEARKHNVALQLHHGNLDDSDEEVYAAAKRLENVTHEYDSEDNLVINQTKQSIEPLKPIDHNSIDYLPINKVNYEEHEDLCSLSDDRVEAIRQESLISVFGKGVPKPCLAFGHFGFHTKLLDRVAKSQFESPTPIQQQAVPIALSDRDLIAISNTGSGKTAAFLWPAIMHILRQPAIEAREGPIGLILAPTRELAQQISTEARKYSKPFGDALRVSMLAGGFSKREQFQELRRGTHLVVATPGRLIELVRMKALNFVRVSLLVIDEADTMLALGFERQVRSIAMNLRKDRQSLLFSATFPRVIERFASALLKNPIRVCIGGSGRINPDVELQFSVVPTLDHKWQALLGILQPRYPNQYNTYLDARVSEKNNATQLIIVFVSSIAGVENLTNLLNQQGLRCAALHGDTDQHTRSQMLRKFRDGQPPLLVATDVAARGLDLPSIGLVVNYDVPRDIERFIHRVGRTGRAQQKGLAITLLTKNDEADQLFASKLVGHLEANEDTIPSPLQMVADLCKSKQYNPKNKRRMNNNSGSFSNKGNKYRPPNTHGIGFNSSNSGSGGGFIRFKKADD